MAPPILVPDDRCATASQIFHPVDPSAVPEIAGLIAWLSAHDPDVLAAVADVDRLLIWAAMQRSPLDHLDACAQMAESLVTLREQADELRT